jgi:hypothetical protein
MSFQLMAWAMEQRTGSSSEKFVLVALADRANGDTGECFPKVDRLAEDTQLSNATVRRCLKALADDGFVKRERQRRDDGSLGVYFYEFPLAQDLRTPPITMSGRASAQDERAEPGRGEDLEPEGVTPLGSAHKRIYDHWRAARGKTRSTYDTMSTERRRKIAARLKEFTEAQLMQAIDGVGRDPWPDRSKHDDITVIFRSREQVDRFLEMADSPSDLEAFYDHAKRAEAEARRRHAG